MNRPETRVLETAAGPGALGEIETALERTWSANPHVPHTVRMHMGIAAGEIGANIVEHRPPPARYASGWTSMCRRAG
jgi:serine/threonine-protein kinase RsbW